MLTLFLLSCTSTFCFLVASTDWKKFIEEACDEDSSTSDNIDWRTGLVDSLVAMVKAGFREVLDFVAA